MSQKLANFASTTLNGAINNSTTSVVVTDGSVFPASGDFYVLVESEIMKVTARSTNTLTVVRAQESTAAASHADLSLIKLTLTKGTFEDYFGERISIGSYASFPSSPRAGQLYYASDLDVGWRYDGSNWDMIHPLYIPYANQMDVSSWTHMNQSTAVVTTQARTVNYQNKVGTGGDDLRGMYKSVPSAPYTATLILRNPPTNQQFTLVGMFLSDGTKLRTISVLGASSIGQGISVDAYNNVTSYNSTQMRESVYLGDYVWLRIKDDNTNWLFQYSVNGKNYVTAYSVARNNFLTATQIGFFMDRTETTYPGPMHNQFLGYWEF